MSERDEVNLKRDTTKRERLKVYNREQLEHRKLILNRQEHKKEQQREGRQAGRQTARV